MNPALRSPALYYRCFLILLSATGLWLGTYKSVHLTTITNAIVLGYLVVTVFTMITRRTTEIPAPRLRGLLVTWMIFICIVAYVMLDHLESPFVQIADPDPLESLNGWSKFVIHDLMPIGLLIDFIAFRPHGRMRWMDVLWSAVYPLFYGLVQVLRAYLFPFIEHDNRIPYPFMEPGSPENWGGVILYLLPMTGLIAALCVAFIGIDKLMARVTRGSRAAQAPS